MRRRAFAGLLLAGLLPGCGYDPPMVADHASAAYKADLDACNDTGGTAAAKRAGATFRRWVTYPFSYPPLKREEVRACLVKKGYALAG